MLVSMRRTIQTLMPAVVVAALSIGLATPAAADVTPKRERKTRTLEPQHAPEMAPPPEPSSHTNGTLLYIHRAKGRRSRALDDTTEAFVDSGRTGTGL